ncbi:transposase IS116/IS110/IS902 family protein [Leucobacter luti]|uniref:Transposase IS116/IS110/IS902 family protein n=1 Tax=Leucobacter luti TaxID=340320 RepID=A0A4R6RQS2_9MICO|nr:IS110 family transposase [Leucobacter luti]TDP89052.1 transposase IS116/IS110/IS902 family protein [Leucobacter luti]
MSSIAHTRPFVVGVDTHARSHVYAILTATGEVIETHEFPTNGAGINRAIDSAGRRTGGDLSTLWVIEGAASYGAPLTAAVTGYQVAEAPRMGRHLGHGVGKSDPLDAQRIAAAVLPLDDSQLRTPRLGDGVRAALRVLVAARESMTGERTRCTNALTALLRVNDLGIDARKPLNGPQIREVSRWRTRSEHLAISIARAEAVRLAKRIRDLDDELTTNLAQLTELIRVSEAAPLLDEMDFGPVSLAICLTAWSHAGRIHTEAAFASMAGVNPIPASAGNTIRHRLNRGGDRRLNHAHHMVALSRMIHDDETRAYVEKRRAEGRTTKEIRRSIKRYLARRVYRVLNTTQPATSPA